PSRFGGERGPGGPGLGAEGLSAIHEEDRRHRPAGPDRGRDRPGLATGIQRHEKLFGTRPEVLAADKGFCPAEAKFEELAARVDTLAIPRRMQDFMDKVL